MMIRKLVHNRRFSESPIVISGAEDYSIERNGISDLYCVFGMKDGQANRFIGYFRLAEGESLTILDVTLPDRP